MKSDLKTPYAYVLNASIARPLKGGMTLEVGYQGRLSHSLLMQQDVGGVAWNFKDPTSAASLWARLRPACAASTCSFPTTIRT